MDIDIDTLIAYEGGELAFEDQIEFFADLIRTGAIGHLQGSYGRAAATLVRHGFITADGEVNQQAINDALENA